MNYYETYLALVEEELEKNVALNQMDQLKNVIFKMIEYKIEHYQLTSFIERELTLDSTFVREMTVTYLAKENHILKQLLFSILHPKFKQLRNYFYMQLKGMLMSPFLLKEEWNYQMFDKEAYQHFLRQFTNTIHLWLDVLVAETEPTIID